MSAALAGMLPAPNRENAALVSEATTDHPAAEMAPATTTTTTTTTVRSSSHESSPSSYSSSTASTSDAHHSTPHGDHVQNVNVAKGKTEFESLQRELSRASSIHRARTRDSALTAGNGADLEKQHDQDSEDDFDLREYLHSGSEARKAHGFKQKQIGVTWEGLRVIGVGGMKIYIRTFPDAIKEFVLSPVFMVLKHTKMFKSAPKNLLHSFDGFVRPGEMCLVLGRPGSGCSTFLKTIANQRGGYLGVEGDVSYGGIPASEMGERYKGEVVYNQEDDVHHAELTVAQTLTFALSLKTPGKRLPDESAAEFKKNVLDLLTNMLGISHTKNTKVGSAQVRGVSGGERKRVSIAEMMVGRASVTCWDNSTRGLDASTALDYAKSLRILTDIFGTATLVTLYQAGEGIVEQFDKILLIDEGREVYFGPAKEARAYMVSLGYKDQPRSTTADFLTGCTDPNERQLADGRDESNVPSTPEQLEQAFKKSEIHARMKREREAFNYEVEQEKARLDDFRQAVLTDKHRGVRKTSPYTVSLLSQVRALAVRQFELKLQNRLDLGVSFSTTIIIAIISGACYFQIPATAEGAFTRGGAIFIALLFNAFQAFNELPTQMLGRPIMWKHANFAFHRPAAVTLAATVADAPFSILSIFLFCVIIYFMAGLTSTASAFFTFYVIVLAGFFSLAAFFRLIGTLTASFDVAARLASILITLMITYSGYLIPIYSQKRWLFWLTYLNPLNYAFAAAMMNEFKDLQLACSNAYITPRQVGGLTQYPTTLGPNQVCTLLGSQPGQPFVAGADYLRVSYEYEVSHLWRNFGLTLVFFIGFNVFQSWAVERFKHGADAPAINVFAKETAETKDLNEKLLAKREAKRKGQEEQDLASIGSNSKPFTWENLRYTVPVPGGRRQLLDDVFGYVKPGTLTALMGSSGAGKTTLLDVLAARKNIGVIEGDILIGGRPTTRSFKRGCAYAEQLDVHEHTATVRETFRFSAYLRQPAHVAKAEKDAYVEEIIQLLELEDLADAYIGFPGFGLGVEARKRVTIGVELAAKPEMLLFLDEPTSGLDAQSALNIARFLKKLAAAGQAILCTIHQPNALLFESFDRLLLLKAGGRCVYFGDIGKDSIVIRDYFAKRGALCPPKANPAEYMLEAIGAGSSRAVGKKDWADLWLESEELGQVKKEIAELKQHSLALPADSSEDADREFATPFIYQLKVVANRTAIAFYRSPDYGFTRLFNHLAIALCVSITFLNLGNNLGGLQQRVFAIFYVTVLPAIIISQVEPMYIMSRSTFVRESSSGMYSQVVFAMSQLAAEMPYSIMCAVGFFLLLYYPIGFQFESSRAGFQFFMILIVELWSVTLGQGVAALSPSVYIAAVSNPFILVILSLFCGITITPPNIPKAFHWLYQLNPQTRIVSALIATALYELPVQCTPREFAVFEPPAGQSCSQWAAPFVQAVKAGYLNNPNASSACEYCSVSLGQQFYEPLGIRFDTRWRDLGILIAFTVFNCGVTIVASRFLKYAKR
ncbi:BZ3500_MvSof-1268-A1-R1_Chr1-2g01305 [Microbotryum saponariae]|uniref:BZ3500_MvSof-1268-A1-R1_Chr1-2g01305 protein n=1 Tax=Microbotryum saponariae TaxID=289078 RepID=A0A2X0KY52_9BASI|nr:BZ3500_MvSof-1268-A1-R1_Chr1-2g01305 [Microbotryum saponariae]SCZ97036.1 BZ3501_MvSof-1269-A2-R1_Chr1-2g00904 [Microbotryum saponariae]